MPIEFIWDKGLKMIIFIMIFISILWYITGIGFFILFITSDSDFTVEHIFPSLLAGILGVIVIIMYLGNLYSHKVLIRKRGSKNE